MSIGVSRRLRRALRVVRAGASIALAVAAGTFLVLHGRLASAATPERAPDAGAGRADAGTAPRGRPDAGVDKHQHRNGMPVHDNLLE